MNNYNDILYKTTKKVIDDIGQPVGKANNSDATFDYNKSAIVKFKKQAIQNSTYLMELKDQYLFTMLEPVNVNYYIGWNNGVYQVKSIDNSIEGIYTMYADVVKQAEKHTYTIVINNDNPLNTKVGDIVYLNCTCTIDGEADATPSITYSANNDNVTITDGKVSFVKEGTTVITATYHNVSASITVNIAKADEYAIQCDNVSGDNGSTIQLTPICTINGVQVSDPVVTYTVTDSSIATCSDNGLVTLTNVGSTTILLEWQGVSKTITVTVNEVILNYTINGAEQFKHLTQSVYTLNPVNNNCVWSLDQDSIDLEIARIDSQDSTSCTVYGYQTSSSEFFTLYAKDGDKVLAEKTITIKKYM